MTTRLFQHLYIAGVLISQYQPFRRGRRRCQTIGQSFSTVCLSMGSAPCRLTSQSILISSVGTRAAQCRRDVLSLTISIAGCAKHISKPVRRVEPCYLPPKKPSSDPRFAAYPLRRTARARKGSQSPSKRSASGSVSPSKDLEGGHPSIEEDDLPDMVTPPQENIQAERAKRVMARFRDSCLASAHQCTVSGMGRSWYANPTIAPALHACHIVPQQQYHLYPDSFLYTQRPCEYGFYAL